jgi:hypothetical protein
MFIVYCDRGEGKKSKGKRQKSKIKNQKAKIGTLYFFTWEDMKVKNDLKRRVPHF